MFFCIWLATVACFGLIKLGKKLFRRRDEVFEDRRGPSEREFSGAH